MTEIVRTEGIVLRKRDFLETSRIAVVYTRDRGKVQLLAKGARRPRSKYGAALEPLSRGEFVFYWREGRDLFTLSEAAARAAYNRLGQDADALPYALAAAEAVDRLSREGDADAGLFDELDEVLAALNAGGPPAALLTRFLLRVAARLGFGPALTACAICGREKPRGDVTYSPAEGSVACAACRPAAGDLVLLSKGVYNFVMLLGSLAPSQVARVRISEPHLEQALAFITGHLKYHVDLQLRSLTVTTLNKG